ncbi:hypothetical protein [Flavisphingomonas formosensis]|uniref:hypothetical protein n=1 Tax=Flavisphingomonas formosensis TaxID=861534 RepID=UPI0012FA3C17|nr:hypothetical protein [Sphingomonas formosensis]
MTHDDPITIPVDLQKLFEIPTCSAISLPDMEPLVLRLPTGAKIQAIPDLTKGIPTDCSLVANIFLQLAPFLASIECLVKVLAVLKPLMDVMEALKSADLVKIAGSVGGVIDALKGLADCFKILIPAAGIFDFVKDLLLLIIKIIKCLIGQLETVLGIMQGIELRLGEAEAAGNTELAAVLQCAKENATNAANHAGQSLGPVTNIMPLVSVFLEMAGVSLELPALGSAEDSAALQNTIDTLKDTVTTIESVLETLP